MQQFVTLTYFNILPSSYSKDINTTFLNFLSAKKDSGREGGTTSYIHKQEDKVAFPLCSAQRG